MKHSWSRFSPGILLIGGKGKEAQFSVELWSPTNPEEGSCVLDDYPREIWGQPTANFVSTRQVAKTFALFSSNRGSNTAHWRSLHAKHRVDPRGRSKFATRWTAFLVTGGSGGGSEYHVTENQLTGDGAERELNGVIMPSLSRCSWPTGEKVDLHWLMSVTHKTMVIKKTK